MSVTYTDQVSPAAAGVDQEAYVPVYARSGARKSNKPVKTWMILAPLGVLVLGGAAAAMLMQPAEPAAPTTAEVAPSAITPEVSPLTAATIPMQTPAELTTATSIPPAAAALVDRRAIPAPARASAPLARAERVAPAPVEPAVDPVAPIVSPTAALSGGRAANPGRDTIGSGARYARSAARAHCDHAAKLIGTVQPERPGSRRAFSFRDQGRVGVTRQMTLPTSSATRSPPERTPSTPTGRPMASPLSLRKPVRTSCGGPAGLPSLKGTKMTL